MNEFLRNILFLPPQASTVARDIDYLHYFVITVTMLGATAVGVATLVYFIRYRGRAHRGRSQSPDERRGHTRGGLPVSVELGVIAFLLTLFVSWWIIGFRQYVRLQAPPDDALDIYVMGKKWMWKFAYPDGSASVGVLYVPEDRPIRLALTSRDVIHSFFVPAFRIKQDAVPGRTTTVWFEATEPGTYDIYCTEYCGTGHSTMLAQVVVLSGVDYEEQLRRLPEVAVAGASYTEPASVGMEIERRSLSLAAMGERVAADKGCLRCHTVDSTPHIGPTWAGLYGSVVPLDDGTHLVANEAYLTQSMMDPRAQIHLGFRPIMPPYQGRLTAGETGALVEYIRSLRDLPGAAERSPLSPSEAGRAPVVELPIGEQPAGQQPTQETTGAGQSPAIEQQPTGAGQPAGELPNQQQPTGAKPPPAAAPAEQPTGGGAR